MAPGIVFEKIIVDFGGYEPSYLFMDETPYGKADVTLQSKYVTFVCLPYEYMN